MKINYNSTITLLYGIILNSYLDSLDNLSNQLH